MKDIWDEPWICPSCKEEGYPCSCEMDAEDERLARLYPYRDYNPTEEEMQIIDDAPMSKYEELDELYEDTPKFQKIQRSMTPVSDGHNLQRVTENARNRQLKAARKTKDLLRERVE